VRPLRHAAIILLSILFLIEETLWRGLRKLAAALGRWRLVQRLEARLQRCNRYIMAALFLVPIAIILPIKLYGTALIATGAPMRGIAVILAAKLVGTTISVRIWSLTRDKLLTFALIAWSHGHILSWKRRIHAWLNRWPVWWRLRAGLRWLHQRARQWWRLTLPPAFRR